MYAVTVNFTIKPGLMQQFMPHMQANARASLDHEPGCRQFDVCTDPARPDAVFLYELYVDEAAFELHQTMDHYAAFGKNAGDMIATKDVQTFEAVIQ